MGYFELFGLKNGLMTESKNFFTALIQFSTLIHNKVCSGGLWKGIRFVGIWLNLILLNISYTKASSYLMVDFGYDKQCEAFAEFLYYIHILGDIPDSDIDEGYNCMCNLTVAEPNDKNPDIYYELLQILPIIFSGQTNNPSYTGLITDIKMQATEARNYIRDNPDLKSNYTPYKDYATALLEKLERKIPDLLKNEPFFRDVFYKN